MELTADDLWPLVAKLEPDEQLRLARRTLARRGAAADAAEAYRRDPVTGEEFADEGDPLAWESEGWDDVP